MADIISSDPIGQLHEHFANLDAWWSIARDATFTPSELSEERMCLLLNIVTLPWPIFVAWLRARHLKPDAIERFHMSAMLGARLAQLRSSFHDART